MKILYTDKRLNLTKVVYLKEDDKRAEQIIQMLEGEAKSSHVLDLLVKLVGKVVGAIFRPRPEKQRRPH